MTIQERIANIVDNLRDLVIAYPWIKLALASVIGVLGGSGFITFLNKYAIYNYAVSYGGRLPVENVPYIDVAISVLSFAFLAISLISALLAYGLLTYIAEVLHKNFESLPQTIIKMLSGIITSVIAAIVSGAFKLLQNENLSISIQAVNIEFITIVLGAGILLGALIIWKSLIRPFALLTSIALISLVAHKLFDAENYASFLREIQYGGGVAVTLVLKSGEETGHLFLTTETTIIIWSPNESSFIETPLTNINEIKFHELAPHELPEISGSLARIFRHLWN